MSYKEIKERELAVRIAFHYLGTFYIWGGDDPSGFDCSGFVIEVLKSVGRLPRSGDWTAHDLRLMFPETPLRRPQEGDLVFWSDWEDSNIIWNTRHVEIVIGDGSLSIGASGGGSRVRTIRAAQVNNAFIKIRPVEGRTGKVSYADPFSTVV